MNYNPSTKIVTFTATCEACEHIANYINTLLNAPTQEDDIARRSSDIDESVEESATKKRMKEYFQKRNRDNALVTIKRE